MAQTNSFVADPAWKTLYRVGGVAALLAVFVFRRYMGAELIAFKGFGVFYVPETMPASATEWFTLLQRHPFVGLTLLEVFDLLEYALVGVMYLALYAALPSASRSVSLIALTSGLVGIAVYISANQAFGLLSLSTQYAAAATDAQRAAFLAAGEASLATSNPGALLQGTGIYAGRFLVLLSGLMVSVVMLQGSVFSKLTAVAGILANSFALGYFVVLVFAPAMLALPFILSAPFRVTWYFLSARKLFQLGAGDRGNHNV